MPIAPGRKLHQWPKPYWQQGQYSVYHGDCVEVLSELKASGVTTSLVFADPPFNINYDYDQYYDDRPAGEYVRWCREWMMWVMRLLKPDGSFWLAIGDKYVTELDQVAKSVGFVRRDWVVWHYTFGVNCTGKFTPSHTHLLHYVVAPKRFTFNAPAVKVPSARQTKYKDSRAHPNGRLPNDVWVLDSKALAESLQGFGIDTDTWYVSRVCGTFKERLKGFPCQMPTEILRRIVAVSSNPGELVVDPFLGSGTTIEACIDLGRRCYGIELSKGYIDTFVVPRISKRLTGML